MKGKKGREEEKRSQEQRKENVRAAAEKNRQRNQGESKQTNVIKSTLSKISTRCLFQGWKGRGFCCNSLWFKGCQY